MDNNEILVNNNTENMAQAHIEPEKNIESAVENVEIPEEEQIGEHDIVIEEDFEINMDVAAISDTSPIDSSAPEEQNNQNNVVEELGTEQSGNITF